MIRRAAFALLLVLVACGSPADPASRRVVAEPSFAPTPSATQVATAAPTAAPRLTAAKPARPAQPRANVQSLGPVAGGSTAPFTGLGAWVDVFDIDDDPAFIVGAVRDMAAHGVRTLYLETSRFNRASHIENPHTVAAALREAHGLGMRVVAWYPPDFVDLERDIERTLAAVRYVSPEGERFDAVGVDIERTDVADPAERNARLVELSRRVRAGAPGYPLAAIVIAPMSLKAYPNRWPDFPWQTLAELYDVFMPMAYWTFRSADAGTASSSTEANLAETRRLTGKPVHIIGGEAEKTDEAQAAAYVSKALAGGSLGGGIYDYRTTRQDLWAELRKLNP